MSTWKKSPILKGIAGCFRDPIRVSRIENRVPRNREIGSPQVHTGYLTFSFKKTWYSVMVVIRFLRLTVASMWAFRPEAFGGSKPESASKGSSNSDSTSPFMNSIGACETLMLALILHLCFACALLYCKWFMPTPPPKRCQGVLLNTGR